MTEQSITEKLSDLQKILIVPKNRHNKFGNYYYRSCEDIVEAVKKIMPEGCYLTISDEIVMIGDRFYVKARAAFVYKEMQIASEAYARESLEKKGMDASQLTGSCSSYARKYALCGLFAIDDSEDTDCQVDREQQSYTKKAETISDECALEISKMIFDTKTNFNDVKSHYKVGSLNDLNWDQANEVKRRLSEKIKQADYLRV